jgi:hypothetical protein
VASERTAAETAPWVRRLEAEGFRVETESADVDGTTWQRVVLPGLRNGHEAREMVAWLDSQMSLKSWVVPKGSPAAPPEPAAAPDAPAMAPPPPVEPAQPGAKPADPARPEN